MLSHAATLWIRDARVPFEKLKTLLAADRERGWNISFWRRPKLTVVHTPLDQLDQRPFDRARELAQKLGCEVYALYAMTGTEEYALAAAFDSKGKELWRQESPARATSESRRVAKALGLKFLTESEAERLDEKDELDDDAPRLHHVPYWRLHLELGLPGKRPLVDLSIKPALERLGSGWTDLEAWLTAEQEERAREKSSAANAALPKIEAVLARLAKRARGQKVTLFSATEALVGVVTEESQAAVVKKLMPRSIVLRKSKHARRTAARSHEQAFLKEKVGLPADVLLGGLSLELIQKHFGPKVEVTAPWGWNFAEGAFESDEGDPEANAWNSLTELTNAEVVQALAESPAAALQLLFSGHLREQIRQYIKADPALFAPALAEALLANPRNSELDTFNWLLLEPAVKKHAKNQKYLKTLKQLWAKTKSPRYLDALVKVGLPRPKYSPSRELLNAADYV